MQLEILSESPGFTINLGQQFSKIISGGDIVLFSGELGGGKTTFISGMARGLKIGEDLSSPSFTILNEYPANRVKLVHIDFYRIDGLDEFENIGLDDYIYDDSRILCIEWGEKIQDFIKKDYLRVSFNYLIESYNSLDKRLITFKSSNPYWDKKLEKLKNILEKKAR